MQETNTSFKIMKIHKFEIMDKTKPNTENIRDLNLVEFQHMTNQVTNNSVVTGATFDMT